MLKKGKSLAGILMVMAVCFASGACIAWGMAPAIVAVYVLAGILSGWVTIPYICVISGLAVGSMGFGEAAYSECYLFPEVSYSGIEVLQKYMMLISVILCVVKVYNIRTDRNCPVASGSRRGYSKFIPGGYLTAISVAIALSNITTYIENPGMAFMYAVIEIVIFLCLINILRPGMLMMTFDIADTGEKDRGGVSEYDLNQVILSKMFIAAICMWALPAYVYKGINPVLIAGLFALIYTVHCAGASYGFGIAVMAGGIVSIKMGGAQWLLWFLVIALVMLVCRALVGSKKLFSVIFYLVGAGLAVLAGGKEMTGTGSIASYICNILVPVVLFWISAGHILNVRMDETSGACMQAAATEMTRLAAAKMEDMANTFRRLDYTFAGTDEPAISLCQVGELVDGFRKQISSIGDAKEIVDDKLIKQLKYIGLEEVRVTASAENENRNRYYIAGRTNGQGMVLSRQVADALSSYFGKNIRVGMNSPSLFFEDYRSAVYEESALYKGSYHVRRIKKYGAPVSGDNFSVKEYEDGRLVMMLSDGMGSGSVASCESCMMIDTMEELMEAGFDPGYSISFANSCISRKNKGRTFTTFDMVSIDMYSGSLKSYKQGASETFILHPGEKENDIEIITSTTLPVGVLDGAECDVKETELASGDAVVMISDGLTDMGDEDRLLSVLRKIKIGDSRKMVDNIIGRMLGFEDSAVRDDVTVMAVVMWDS